MLNHIQRFYTKITLEEFQKFVQSKHRKYTFVNATYTTSLNAKSPYKAIVTENGETWLYLFIPRSENGNKFWSISRKKTDDETEGSFIDYILHGSIGDNKLGNNPRITFSKRKNK